MGVLLTAVKPRLAALALLPIARPLWRSVRFKLRHETSPTKYLFLPVARLVATTSNLAGFLVGRYRGE